MVNTGKPNYTQMEGIDMFSTPSKMLAKIRLALVTLLVVVGLVAGSSPASAHVDWNRPSKQYKNDGGWMPIRPCPTTACYPTGWVKSGSTFYMDCYEVKQYAVGNYGSSVWFYGYNGYWGYVHSSFVYNQRAVHYC